MGNTLAVATAVVTSAPIILDASIGLASDSSVASISPVQEGTTVYRVYSGVDGSDALGSWWSGVNPATVPNYAEASGMHKAGGYMAQGTIDSSTGFPYGFAAPNAVDLGGGLLEVFIHNPASVLTDVITGLPFP